MATYGCRCYNDKGVETGRIDGRCFMVDIIQIDPEGASEGSRTYSNVDPVRFTLRAVVSQQFVGAGSLYPYPLMATVSGQTVNWRSIRSGGIIFVMKTENAV
ncbi:TPA: hypothetical protein P5S08_004647 [Salmonella enterica subsp. enterica serovar Concord]|nr:hypothetical protein [Salmonella enterica subsp. enterica serovar Concord]